MKNKTSSISIIFDFPIALSEFAILDVGKSKHYFDLVHTDELFQSYLKKHGIKVIHDLIEHCNNNQEETISAYFSSTYLGLLQRFAKPALDRLIDCVQSGHLDIIGGTSYGSLSSLYSAAQLEREIVDHKNTIKHIFNYSPSVFYNTENIYSNELSDILVSQGYLIAITGAIEWYLGSGYDSRVFSATTSKKLKIGLIDEHQSNALAKNRDQKEHVFQFNAKDIEAKGGLTQVLTLIREKSRIIPLAIQIGNGDLDMSYNIKAPIVASLENRTLNSFHGNAMQTKALKRYYAMEKQVYKQSNVDLQNTYLQLGVANYFANMATSFEKKDRKPYEQYNNYMNVLSDLELRLNSN
jgi:hypothetical protein